MSEPERIRAEQQKTADGRLACQECGSIIRINPNRAQCDVCTMLFCSKHRRRERVSRVMVCVRCS